MLSQCNISSHGKDLEVVDEFRYCGVKFNQDSSGKAEVKSNHEREEN